jgi:hypothetical protein
MSQRAVFGQPWTGRQHLYEEAPTEAEIWRWASVLGVGKAANMINGRLAHMPAVSGPEHPVWATLELAAAALDPKQERLPL